MGPTVGIEFLEERENLLSPPGFEPRIVQSAVEARQYLNWWQIGND